VCPGEAGLIAARGSFLGIGSDIGGSIRIPSLCCGIYGFKPTPSRVSAQGMRMPFLGNGNGQQAIHPVAGPMGIAVDDLALVMRYTKQGLGQTYGAGSTAEKGGYSVV
jgi:Asp-tRNA(Asn)/Glu-tRNA(Gln) amidotransferase A subunit family amidase